jgi:hypothetical protein
MGNTFAVATTVVAGAVVVAVRYLVFDVAVGIVVVVVVGRLRLRLRYRVCIVGFLCLRGTLSSSCARRLFDMASTSSGGLGDAIDEGRKRWGGNS